MILALESSCDETALAIVDDQAQIHLNVCISQISLHQKYGGVVPELASRFHFDVLDELSGEIRKALTNSSIHISQISAVAATMGPGLVGPLLVGSSFAKGLAASFQKPFVGVHHLRAHVASAVLDKVLKGSISERAHNIFPAYVLLVSGGHCLLMISDSNLNLKIIKSSSDDAAGECFDKCAKLIGLPYPGGPAIEKEAQKCTTQDDLALAYGWARQLPRPKSSAGFSFAGLKTAFRLLTEQDKKAKQNIPALCKALEIAIINSIVLILKKEINGDIKNLICCGGVAANLHLRKELEGLCNQQKMNFYSVPLEFATDNAVMVSLSAMLQSTKVEEKSVFSRGGLL